MYYFFFGFVCSFGKKKLGFKKFLLFGKKEETEKRSIRFFRYEFDSHIIKDYLHF